MPKLITFSITVKNYEVIRTEWSTLMLYDMSNLDERLNKHLVHESDLEVRVKDVARKSSFNNAFENTETFYMISGDEDVTKMIKMIKDIYPKSVRENVNLDALRRAYSREGKPFDPAIVKKLAE